MGFNSGFKGLAKFGAPTQIFVKVHNNKLQEKSFQWAPSWHTQTDERTKRHDGANRNLTFTNPCIVI